MRTAQDIELPASGSDMPETDDLNMSQGSAGARWVEVLFDRMDQLEFTLSGETGAQGELLRAVGEIGAQLDTVLAQLDRPVQGDRSAAAEGPDPAPDESDLSMALNPVHDALSRLLILVQGIASRQDRMAEVLSDRIGLIEARVSDPPPPAGSADLVDRVAGLEARLDERLRVVLDRPLPRPDLAPVHQSVARIATAIKGHADDHQRALDTTALRLDRIETAVSAFAGPRALASLVDALEARLSDRIDRGLQAIMAALPPAGPVTPDPEREALTRATAALEAAHRREAEIAANLTASLEEMVPRLVGQAADGPAATKVDELTERVVQLLDERHAHLVARLDDMARTLVALRAQDPAHRLSAHMVTALSALSRANADQHANTQALILAALPAREPVDTAPAIPPGISDILAAAAALQARLSFTTGDEGAVDPVMEGLTRDLRITIAEILAKAERRLSLEGRATG